MKPPAPDLRRQTAGWAQTFREDWEECRNDPDYAPSKAWSLLAAWGAVCRLYAEPPPELIQLPDLLRRDAEVLLTALAQAPQPAEWLDRARDLDRAWDVTVRADHLSELEDAAAGLFNQLDRHRLAECMARRLLTNGTTPDWLACWSEQLSLADAFFADHVEAFFPAASQAAAVLAGCRADLDEADPELWQTTLNYRHLEEAWEELTADPVLPQLGVHDLRAIQNKLSSDRRATLPLVERASIEWVAYAGVAAAPVQNGWTSYECQEPERQYKALFDLLHPDQQPEVVVTFYRNGHHAGDLAGQTVRLRGVPATIDKDGKAQFPRAALDNQTGPLRLEVGEPPAIWPFLSEPQR